MSAYPAKILLVEDDLAIATTLRRVLAEDGYEVQTETAGEAGLIAVKANSPDVVVTDLKLPGLSGLDLVRQLHPLHPRLPILVMTAHGTTETAIEAIQAGAFDYIVKPFEIAELLRLIKHAVTARRLMSEPVQLGKSHAPGSAIVGASRAMQAIYKEIGRVAASPVSVLIRGETGTGKELIARAIYQHSTRHHAPFIAINCAAIPETLLESELFGHERGAFTGAETRRIGRFEQADHGTIFLDEIGDMTPGTQVKLMRVLQEKCIQRLGGRELVPVDVRVIAATHRDLENAIHRHQFRQDLYYRLSVVELRLPALRERPEDIPDLARFFLNKYSAEFHLAHPAIHADALAFLRSQPWPGNVRELENVIRKVLLLARGFTISVDFVKAALVRSSPLPAAAEKSLHAFAADLLAAAQRGDISDAYAQLHEAAERALIAQAIEKAQGNQTQAARWLGISRLTLREKLIQFGLHPLRED